MKKIVVIGGGSGIFNVLKGLKKTANNIVSIVTTFDDGGSTGVLRDEFGILPPGDIRRSLVALSHDRDTKILRELFSFRFPSDSSLKGHNFGNLFLQALMNISNNQVEAIQKAGEILNIKGTVLPISLNDSRLCAELENGKIIKGEKNIDIPKHNGKLKIKKVFLDPVAKINFFAKREIETADLIIFGPGDLYTSIIPNTIVSGFVNALSKSKAKTLYINNIMTKWGETHGFYASDFSETLLKYIGREKFDFVFCDKSTYSKKILENYKKEKSFLIKTDLEKLKKLTDKVILKKFVKNGSDIIRHDSDILKREIIKIL